MSDFSLLDSFHIDNDELAEYDKHVCFVLGVEWAQVINFLDEYQGLDGTFIVHLANKERLQKAIDRRRRECEWTFPHDDLSEEWVYLKIIEA